jgi:hypothetical protein
MTGSVGLLPRPAYRQEKSRTLLLQTFPDAGNVCAHDGPARYIGPDDHSLPELARQGRFSDIFRDMKGVTARKPSFLPLEFGFLMLKMGRPGAKAGVSQWSEKESAF